MTKEQTIKKPRFNINLKKLDDLTEEEIQTIENRYYVLGVLIFSIFCIFKGCDRQEQYVSTTDKLAIAMKGEK